LKQKYKEEMEKRGDLVKIWNDKDKRKEEQQMKKFEADYYNETLQGQIHIDKAKKMVKDF